MQDAEKIRQSSDLECVFDFVLCQETFSYGQYSFYGQLSFAANTVFSANTVFCAIRGEVL